MADNQNWTHPILLVYDSCPSVQYIRPEMSAQKWHTPVHHPGGHGNHRLSPLEVSQRSHNLLHVRGMAGHIVKSLQIIFQQVWDILSVQYCHILQLLRHIHSYNSLQNCMFTLIMSHIKVQNWLTECPVLRHIHTHYIMSSGLFTLTISFIERSSLLH